MRQKVVSLFLTGVLMTGIVLYSASCACAQPVETVSLTVVHDCCREGSPCASDLQTSKDTAEFASQAVLHSSEFNIFNSTKVFSKLDPVKAAEDTLRGLELSPTSGQGTYLRISVLLI